MWCLTKIAYKNFIVQFMFFHVQKIEIKLFLRENEDLNVEIGKSQMLL